MILPPRTYHTSGPNELDVRQNTMIGQEVSASNPQMYVCLGEWGICGFHLHVGFHANLPDTPLQPSLVDPLVLQVSGGICGCGDQRV